MTTPSAEKKCPRCLITRPRSDYWGNDCYCKFCRGEKNRNTPRGPRNNQTEAARERKRRYSRKHPNPVQRSARNKVRDALVRGELTTPNGCEVCGRTQFRVDGGRAIQAHHDDYTKPLDVRWLCAKCHNKWHRENKAIGDDDEQEQ